MSTFGSKVVAVLDTSSAFGVTIKQLKESVDSHTSQLNTLLADAPETLDTLNEIAAAIADNPAFFSDMALANTNLQGNIDALQTAASNARDALQTLLETSIDTKFSKSGGTLTGNLAVAKSFPDIELKAGDEKRILFSDAGGGATAALKHVSTNLDFYAGGIASSNKELTVGADNVTVHNRLNVNTLNIPIAAPGSPVDGDIYFDKTALKLKVYVDDGNSTQWVQL